MTQIKNISYDGLADGLIVPTNGSDPGYTGDPWTATGTYINSGATLVIDDGDEGTLNYHSFTARTNSIYGDANTASCACGHNDLASEAFVGELFPIRLKAYPTANVAVYQTKSGGTVASQIRVNTNGQIDIRQKQNPVATSTTLLALNTNYWIRFRTAGNATTGHVELELYDENINLLETVGDWSTNYDTVGLIDYHQWLWLSGISYVLFEVWTDDAVLPTLPTPTGVDDPLVITDIELRYSVKTGSAGDSQAGTAAGSLGKYMSTTVVTQVTPNDIFDDVSGAENSSLDDEYRCLFVYNSNTTYSWYDVVLWLKAENAGSPAHAFGIDTTAASDHESVSAQALEVADEDTAPAGVAFSAPSEKASGLSLGTLGPGECRAFWIRRTAIDSGVVSGAGYTFRLEGNTEAA